MISSGIIVLSTGTDAAEADAGEVTVNGEKSEDSLEKILEELSNATGDGTITDIVLSSGNHTITKTITLKNSVSIVGAGIDKTTVTVLDNKAIIFAYSDGTKVSLEGINFICCGEKNSSGSIRWNNDASSYGGKDNPEVMPTFDVSNCRFTSDGGVIAGIGIWDNGSHITAASEITIIGCIFEEIRAGIYFSESTPLVNAKALIEDNRFSNIEWCGIAGSPANSEIRYNEFEDSCGLAIQFLLNKDLAENGGSDTKIHNNIINSKKGIEVMPYLLNEYNGNGTGETIIVTSEMLPEITKNNREIDDKLVVLVAYRGGTDEVLSLAPGSLNLNDNYAVGKSPTVFVQYNGEMPEDKKSEFLSNLDNSYVNDHYFSSPIPDAGIDGDEVVIPPVVPDRPSFDEEDEFPFIPGQNSPGKDDTTTYIAVAAAAAVVAVLAVLVMAMNKGKL